MAMTMLCGPRLWRLPRIEVTQRQRNALAAAADSHDLALYSDSQGATRSLVKGLADLGAFRWIDHRQGGWERGMWGAVLTCVGFNALWQADGDRHSDGCDSAWLPDGICSGCNTLRRLDLTAWQDYIAAGGLTESERRRSALWCDEHGYLRPDRQWRTDKTCHVTPASSEHETNTIRV